MYSSQAVARSSGDNGILDILIADKMKFYDAWVPAPRSSRTADREIS